VAVLWLRETTRLETALETTGTGRVPGVESSCMSCCMDAHVPDARSPRPSSPIQAFKLPMHSHSSFIDSTSCSYLGLLILLVSNNSVRADSRIRSLRSIPCAISTNMSKVDAIRARECSQSTIRAQQVLIEVNVRQSATMSVTVSLEITPGTLNSSPVSGPMHRLRRYLLSNH
jgi:hypothetical protein